MLELAPDRPSHTKGIIITFIALLFIACGGYLLLLSMAPQLTVFKSQEPLDVSALSEPKVKDDRIIIPTINVDIPYGTDGQAALDRGAWWRYPERGNPEKGGNFIIAAHRFSIQATPQSTVEKSPFYHLDKLKKDDPILIDYNGKRYGYKVADVATVPPTQTEIEAESSEPKLTLYSCTLEGSHDGRLVITGTPLGEVTTQKPQS